MSCNYDNTGDYYTCKMSIEEGAFDKICGEHLRNLSDEDVKRVQLIHGNSKILPKIICEKFINLESFEIDVLEIEIQEISEESFSHCENIEILLIKMSENVEISENAFKHNLKLRQLQIKSDLQAPEISWNEKWFQNMESLKEFVFYDSRFLKIPRNAFKKANLTYIDIGNSKIQEFSNESFGNLRNLKHFEVRNVEGVKIKFLDFNIFNQPTELMVVRLNQIECAKRIETNEFHSLKVEFLRDLKLCFKNYHEKAINGEIF